MTTTAKKTNGKTPATAVADGKGEFTIASLARELKLDPRKCRAKLRASDLKHEAGGAWVFPIADKAKITAIVKAAD